MAEVNDPRLKESVCSFCAPVSRRDFMKTVGAERLQPRSR